MAAAEDSAPRGQTEKEKGIFTGGSIIGSKSSRNHAKCMKWLDKSCKYGPYVKFMLDAMKNLGCEVDMDRHIVCEPCSSKVLGGFDPDRKEVVLCENTIFNQACMENVLTHELIHAYDMCRAKYEIKNLKHIACTEECVRERAIKSILCVKDVSEEDATAAVDSVFEACFKDTAPFERIPP